MLDAMGILARGMLFRSFCSHWRLGLVFGLFAMFPLDTNEICYLLDFTVTPVSSCLPFSTDLMALCVRLLVMIRENIVKFDHWSTLIAFLVNFGYGRGWLAMGTMGPFLVLGLGLPGYTLIMRDVSWKKGWLLVIVGPVGFWPGVVVFRGFQLFVFFQKSNILFEQPIKG